MANTGDADNESEALRRTLNVGLSELGYLNGTPAENGDTHLRTIARRFADAFAIVGVLMVGVTFWLPLEFRMFVVAPFGASIACIAIDRGLKNHEPAISRRLAGVFRRGDRA